MPRGTFRQEFPGKANPSHSYDCVRNVPAVHACNAMQGKGKGANQLRKYLNRKILAPFPEFEHSEVLRAVPGTASFSIKPNARTKFPENPGNPGRATSIFVSVPNRARTCDLSLRRAAL